MSSLAKAPQKIKQKSNQSTVRGGKRDGAGRKKGSIARATIEQKATLADLAKSHTETAILTLVRVMEHGESEAARVSAANSVLDRGYGKPSQAVEHTGKDGGPIQTEEVLSDFELARRLAFALERGRLLAKG